MVNAVLARHARHPDRAAVPSTIAFVDRQAESAAVADCCSHARRIRPCRTDRRRTGVLGAMPLPESITDSTMLPPSIARAQLGTQRPRACGAARWRTGSRTACSRRSGSAVTWSALAVDRDAHRDPRLRASGSCRRTTCSKTRPIANTGGSSGRRRFQRARSSRSLTIAIEAPGFALEVSKYRVARLRVERHVRHLQRLDVAAHRRQRRLQLVRHVGHICRRSRSVRLQRLIPPGQLRRHPVERRRDSRDLVAADLGRARRESPAPSRSAARSRRAAAPAPPRK